MTYLIVSTGLMHAAISIHSVIVMHAPLSDDKTNMHCSFRVI